MPGIEPATRRDFNEILAASESFWGERDLSGLHHPMLIEEFSDGALVIRDEDDGVAAYLLGMIIDRRRRAYVHLVAVRYDQRGRGHARALYAAFTRRAATRGCRELKAITTPGNAGSIAFHRALGMDAAEVADYAGPGRPRVVLSGRLFADGS